MPDYSRELPYGFLLNEYKVLKVLGQGAFGITYLAEDISLKLNVAIKEYFPREFASRDSTNNIRPNNSQEERELFQWGKDSFIQEGHTLARFVHPNIVKIKRFFEANGTAYLVMDFCDGESFDKVLSRKHKISYEELISILNPLLNALENIHSANFLHRDIKPGNIFIKEDGTPILLDFGAARQKLSEQSRSMTSMATPGYAALEQYSTSGTSQGPFTDIYGLGATAYRAILGERPPDSTDRLLNESYISLTSKDIGEVFPKKFLRGLDKSLSLKPNERQQSIEELRVDLFGIPAINERQDINNSNAKKWIILIVVALLTLSIVNMFFKYRVENQVTSPLVEETIPVPLPEPKITKREKPDKDKREKPDKDKPLPMVEAPKKKPDVESKPGLKEEEPVNNGSNELIAAYPKLTYQPKLIYPELSRRRGEEGRVMLRLSVDLNGLVTSVEINTSSGFEELDLAAKKYGEAMRFEPHKINNLSSGMNFQVSIIFKLE